MYERSSSSSIAVMDVFILLILLAATCVAYLLHWSFTVDDAAISFSYARNFAEGYGLGALYPGAPRVEGFSNLLWVVLLAAGTKLGLETILVSKILGLVFALGIVALLFFSLLPFLRQRMLPSVRMGTSVLMLPSARWLLLGLLLLPLSLTFTFWSVSGLENSLYGFLIMLAVFFLLQEEKAIAKRFSHSEADAGLKNRHKNLPGLPFGSAISLVLVGMTRPEGLVYAAAGLGYKVLQLVIELREQRMYPSAVLDKVDQKKRLNLRMRNLLIWLGIFLAGYGIFKAWHYNYFAAWWPNPVYAKAGWQGADLREIWFNPAGWVYLRGYFRTFAGVWTIPVLLLGGLVSLRGPERIFPVFALATLVLPLLTPDWMLNYRFVYPFVPFSVALMVFAADQLWEWIVTAATGDRAFYRGMRRKSHDESASLSVAGCSHPHGSIARPQNSEANATQPSKASPFILVISVLVAVGFGYAVARFAWANIRLTQLQLACGYAPMAETRCLNGRMYWTMGEVDQKYRELTGFASQIGQADPLYMIPDIGATSYVHNLRILDLAGLGDYHMARIRQGALLKQYLFQERQPDFIQISGIWTRRTDLTAFKDFREAYIPVEEGQDNTGTMHGTYVRKDLLLGEPEAVLPSSQSVNSEALELAPGLRLMAVDIPTVWQPGQLAAFNTYWVSEAVDSSQQGQARSEDGSAQTEDWFLRLRLLNQQGELIQEDQRLLGYGWYPPSEWQDGEAFRQYSRIVPDVPDGQYILDISLVQQEKAHEADLNYPSFQLKIDISQEAARELAERVQHQVDAQIAAGDVMAAWDTLSEAQEPGNRGIFSEAFDSPALAEKMDLLKGLVLEHLLEQAYSSYQADELDVLLQTIRQAAELNKRAYPDAAWRAFSQELQLAARRAAEARDNRAAKEALDQGLSQSSLQVAKSLADSEADERVYLLYLAASLADPGNTWAQRGLEESRQIFILKDLASG